MKWNLLNQPLGAGRPAGCPTRKEIPIAIPLVLAAASIASSAYGGAKSSEANRKARAQIDAEKNMTDAERRRRKYETWASTASGQNTIRMLQDEAKRAYDRIRGAAAVGGATDAAVAQEKEIQNLKQAEVIAQANADFEDRKDNIDAGYRHELSGLTQQQVGLDLQQGQNIAQAAGGVSSALMNSAVTTFGGTKLGQQWMQDTQGGSLKDMGTGSTPAPAAAPSQPQTVGAGSPAGGGVVPKYTPSVPTYLPTLNSNYNTLRNKSMALTNDYKKFFGL